MFTKMVGATLEENFRYMLETIRLTVQAETDLIANLSNISAVINVYLDNINWVGFYLYKEEQLVLGPFQGLPACERIQMGRGVCGTAAQTGLIQVVKDVHAFPEHIACDSNSKSELVVPLFKNGQIFGVLDIDSPVVGRFTDLEVQVFTEVGQVISDYLKGI